MVLFFSGTGNSEYVAKRIASLLGDDVLNLFSRIRNKDYSEIHSEKPFVVVCPTYAWQIPHILRDYLKNTELTGSKQIYFAMTCGDSIGDAGSYLEKLCREKKMNYMGCEKIVMPENYIAMFNAPNENEAKEIILKASPAIDTVVSYVRNGKKIESSTAFYDRFMSSVVNSAFYAICIKDKKFKALDKCTGCGVCEKNCPTKNISLKNGKPKWNKKCIHCMACICKCPQEAIEYGKKSVGKPRYKCPENLY